MKAAALIINIGFGLLAILSFWSMETSSHPGSAIAFAMSLVYWVAANIILASISFLLGALRRWRSRAG
ncbi:MAG: hypothetical protein ACTHJ3_07620 [Pararhizobium sp.]